MEAKTLTANVVSKADWLAARKALLAKEKEFTRQRDALSAERRKLPMLKIENEYVFEGLGGPMTLRDLFGNNRQLIVYHFMFDPSWDEGCRGCSLFMDNIAGGIEPFKKRMGWTFPWVSSAGNDFNYDFGVTLDPERAEYEYNYASAKGLLATGKLCTRRGEMPGLSVFLRDGESIYHTYSTYQRGLDLPMNTYNLLDMTPLGRQEEGEQRMSWVRHHDRYGAEQVAAAH